MSKLEAWCWTIAILAVLWMIPAQIYRWALVLLALPLIGLALVLI